MTEPTVEKGYNVSIWIGRECYAATGVSESDALQRLQNHLKGIIPILENDIKVVEYQIRGIRDYLARHQYEVR